MALKVGKSKEAVSNRKRKIILDVTSRLIIFKSKYCCQLRGQRSVKEYDCEERRVARVIFIV